MNMIEQRKRSRGQGGFTLIELLVVVAILAVLGGLAVIGIGGLQDTAETTACEADVDTYNTASEAFQVTNDGAAPASIAALEGSGLIKAGRESNFAMAIDAAGEVTSTDCP